MATVHFNTPPPPPHSTLGREVPYSSFVHGGNSSQAGSKIQTMSECISILYNLLNRMLQILLTGQLKEKPTYRVLYLYSSFVHVVSKVRVSKLLLMYHCKQKCAFSPRAKPIHIPRILTEINVCFWKYGT
jgi:hypothetical protein